MDIKILLKEKVNCYATEKNRTCNNSCDFYYTCKAGYTMIKNKQTTIEEILSNNKCR